MFKHLLFRAREKLIKKPVHWFGARANALRFYLIVVMFTLGIIFLLILSVQVNGFVGNFSLNLLSGLVGAILVVVFLDGYLSRTSEKMERELKWLRKSWDDEIVALDRDQISWDKARQSQQWLSWYKWIHTRDSTGWIELWEEVRYGSGLSPRVRWAVEWELEKLRQKAYTTGVFSDDEDEIEEKLQALLQGPEETRPTRPEANHNLPTRETLPSTLDNTRLSRIAVASALSVLIGVVVLLIHKRKGAR